MTNNNSTPATDIRDLARAYGTKSTAADNAGKRLRAHSDWSTYVTMAAGPKVGKASPIVAAAKAVLGVDDTRGTKTGPAGSQTYTKYGNGITGQHVENVAALLKKDLPSNAPVPNVLRVSLSGPGGGTITVTPDHANYDLIRAMFAGE